MSNYELTTQINPIHAVNVHAAAAAAAADDDDNPMVYIYRAPNSQVAPQMAVA